MNQEERLNNKQLWRIRIQNYQSSGMLQKEWCEKENINLNTFRYWMRRLKTEMSENITQDWLKVCISDDNTAEVITVPEEETKSIERISAGIRIHRDNIVIEVPYDAGNEYLIQLLQVVKYV